jgi:hypothetical protein
MNKHIQTSEDQAKKDKKNEKHLISRIIRLFFKKKKKESGSIYPLR